MSNIQENNTPAVNELKPEVLLKIEHMKKSFGNKEVLRDINLVLHRQENVAILGKSGQGKSVAIKCIAGLINQDAGSVIVFGKEVKDLDEEELRQMRIRVGFLFQGSALYDSMSVRENLAFPLTRVMKLKDRNAIDNRIEEMLENVDLKDAINKMPAELSGGMRKRIALARTLILKPDIMLYDEPTTGLDPITSREITELIVSTQKKYKTSSLIITHDMECAHTSANRLMVLDNGVFVAEGSYEDLKKSDNQLVQSLLFNK